MLETEKSKEAIFSMTKANLRQWNQGAINIVSKAKYAAVQGLSVLESTGLLEEFLRTCKEEQIPLPNTRINYLYRDASNYKVPNNVVIKGILSKKEIELILDSLNEEEYFIPEQVGFPAERFGDITEDDHCWMELTKEDFTLSMATPTIDLTSAEVIERFRKAKDNWQDVLYAV